MSPRKKCSAADPSSKSTRTSAAGSGTIIRSPAVPNGVSRIGPNAVCIRLECVQPTPLRRRASISRAGKPLPRTWPAMSQVPTKTSSSRSMSPSHDICDRKRTTTQLANCCCLATWAADMHVCRAIGAASDLPAATLVPEDPHEHTHARLRCRLSRQPPGSPVAARTMRRRRRPSRTGAGCRCTRAPTAAPPAMPPTSRRPSSAWRSCRWR